MLSTAATFTLDGISARPVRAEVDVYRGLPQFSIVGLPDAAVREARERVRAALINCGLEFPLARIVVNLAPASLRKAGPGLDLAIAAALLVASGQVDCNDLSRWAFTGELALDGSTRAVPGALPMAELAHERGADAIVLPAENAAEASLADGIRVIPIETLAQLVQLMVGEWEPARPRPLQVQLGPSPGGPDLADLRGQPQTREALEIAAAGGHSLLMLGAPGSGKSLAATRLPSILPLLLPEEAREVTRIASVRGALGSNLPGGRPFRAPHHTISPAGLVGGGRPVRPGEVTLAHRGVLFLDELGEFRRDALEALRPASRTGEVSIDRGGRRIVLPSRFLLIAAANPCPCGRGEADPDCVCPPAAVQRYQGRLSAALTDEIEILTAVHQPTAAEVGGSPGESSAVIRDRVTGARERQERRLGPGRCNAEINAREIRGCILTPGASALLADSSVRQGLGGRARDCVTRLAQTLADLAGVGAIDEGEVAQALALRRRDRI